MATVANGKVTAVSATVTATAGDKNATCVVTVETVKTVTSEQWKQAMESAEQFVIEMKQSEMTNAIKIDGDKRMQAFGNEMYLYVKETLNDETEYFSYYYDGTKWEKTVIDESDYSQLDSFIDAFANFSFDKVLNAYLGDIDVDTTGIVTITDGKIVLVVVGTDKLEFSDYGTTVINLPKAA
ncbi:MAG: hypothetical protein SOT08_02360 [Candidatus Borkfalkiaceae bacterium]|nr:hypothetical protein [Christensenellaceae bacterium]